MTKNCATQEQGKSEQARRLFDKARALLRKADLAADEYLEKAEARYEARLKIENLRK